MALRTHRTQQTSLDARFNRVKTLVPPVNFHNQKLFSDHYSGKKDQEPRKTK